MTGSRCRKEGFAEEFHSETESFYEIINYGKGGRSIGRKKKNRTDHSLSSHNVIVEKQCIISFSRSHCNENQSTKMFFWDFYSFLSFRLFGVSWVIVLLLLLLYHS